MKLTTNDKKIIREALFLASEWEESVIDAYNVPFLEMDKETKGYINQCKRNIKKFERINKLLGSKL